MDVLNADWSSNHVVGDAVDQESKKELTGSGQVVRHNLFVAQNVNN